MLKISSLAWSYAKTFTRNFVSWNLFYMLIYIMWSIKYFHSFLFGSCSLWLQQNPLMGVYILWFHCLHDIYDSHHIILLIWTYTCSFLFIYFNNQANAHLLFLFRLVCIDLAICWLYLSLFVRAYWIIEWLS